MDRWRDNSKDVFFHRPLRINLRGDQYAAAEYIGEAKRMLFQVKNRRQAGDPVWIGRKVIPVHYLIGEGQVQQPEQLPDEFPVPIINVYASSTSYDDSTPIGAYVARNFNGSFLKYIEYVDGTLTDTVEFNGSTYELSILENVGSGNGLRLDYNIASNFEWISNYGIHYATYAAYLYRGGGGITYTANNTTPGGISAVPNYGFEGNFESGFSIPISEYNNHPITVVDFISGLTAEYTLTRSGGGAGKYHRTMDDNEYWYDSGDYILAITGNDYFGSEYVYNYPGTSTCPALIPMPYDYYHFSSILTKDGEFEVWRSSSPVVREYTGEVCVYNCLYPDENSVYIPGYDWNELWWPKFTEVDIFDYNGEPFYIYALWLRSNLAESDEDVSKDLAIYGMLYNGEHYRVKVSDFVYDSESNYSYNKFTSAVYIDNSGNESAFSFPNEMINLFGVAPTGSYYSLSAGKYTKK